MDNSSRQPFCVYGNDDYRHIDLKKYVKISYRWSDIITAPIVFALVLVLYYLGGHVAMAANISLAGASD